MVEFCPYPIQKPKLSSYSIDHANNFGLVGYCNNISVELNTAEDYVQ